MNKLRGASGGPGKTSTTTTTHVRVNTSLPVATGTAVKAGTLTASTGSWSNHPTSYSYEWMYDGLTSCSTLPSSATLTDPGRR